MESRPSLVPFLADHHLPYIVPAIVFWVISLTFHYIDTRGFLSKYKLHTPVEDLTKNRATRRDVIKFALIQQAAQCLLGYLTAVREPFVPHDYGVALWAQKIHYFRIVAREVMQYIGVDLEWILNESQGYGIGYTAAFAQDTWSSHISNLSRVVGEHTDGPTVTFSAWDSMAARLLYWILVPLIQYIAAMVLADTFQYFTHRAFHVNKWLYKYVHSMHHEIYVPFAYGAFYNHPLETIPIDAIGFPICLSIAGLDNRQAAFFGAIWTFKTVVDHCGYDFPYNPCNIICPHSVLVHDLHHQTWGMKYNFSVYGSFWDRLMGTHWSPLDNKAQEKYKRGKAIAENVASKAISTGRPPQTNIGDSTGVDI